MNQNQIISFFFGKIPAVENYIAMFGYPSVKTVARRNAMQEKATKDAIDSIIQRRTNGVFAFRPFSSFISQLFYQGAKILFHFYKVSEKCNGCGICEKVCSVGVIKMENGRPRFSSKCEHCQGCLSLCPKRAITFARLTSSTPVYHHPGITVSDLIRSK
jgi:ferredoxin